MNLLKNTITILFPLFMLACSQQNSHYEEALSKAGYENNNATKTEISAINDQEVFKKSKQNVTYNWNESSSEEDLKFSSSVVATGSIGANKAKSVKTKKHSTVISSKALTNPYKDKKFIKTADMKFKVKDVYHSLVNIEQVVLANSGFIINSNLQTNVTSTDYYKKSSTVKMLAETYETENQITLRVPSEKLHKSLLKIAEEIDFLDYRIISADDVGLNLLAEELKQKRLLKSSKNIKKNVQRGDKLKDKIQAQQLIFEKETQKDISTLKNLSIEDKIIYSTITIQIYQAPEVHLSEVLNYEQFRYQKPFLTSFADSFKSGFDILLTIITTIINLWPFILIGFLAFFVFKKFRKR